MIELVPVIKDLRFILPDFVMPHTPNAQLEWKRWWLCSMRCALQLTAAGGRASRMAPVASRPGDGKAAPSVVQRAGSDAACKGRDEELLLKLKGILVGNAETHGSVVKKSHIVYGDNALFLSRLRGILVSNAESIEEEKTAESELTPRKEDALAVDLSSVIYSLGQQGKVDEARKICNQMTRRGCVPDLFALSGFHQHISKLETGSSLFEPPEGWGSNLPPQSSMINALCKSGKLCDAYRAAVAMLKKGLAVDTSVLNTLVYGLCKAGYVSESCKLIKEMITPEFFGRVMAADGEAAVKRICTAFEGLLEKGICPDVVFYSTLADGLYKVGKVEEAYFVFKGSAGKSDFSISTCSALIDSLCELGRVDEVCHVANVMVKRGLVGSNKTINSLISRLGEAGEDELALKVFYGLIPNGLRLNCKSVLDGLCNSGELKKASQFLVDMAEKGIISDVETYNSLLSVLCEALDRKKEYDSLEVITRSIRLHNTTTYNILIDVLCKGNRFDEAYRLFRQMPETGCESDSNTYTPLIVKLCEGSRVEEAFILLKEMTETHHVTSSVTGNFVLQAFCGAGKANVAMEIVDWMVSRGFVPDAVSYSALIKGLTKEDRVQEAVTVCNEMFQRGYKPDIGSFNAIQAGLWASGKQSEALKLFQQMVRRAVVPDAITCNILIEGLCKAKKIDAAFKILELMPGTGCAPHLVSYNTLLDAVCNQGDLERAQLLLKEMTDRGCNPDVVSYNTLLLGFSKLGRQDETPKLFKEMIRKGYMPTESTYGIVFDGLCEAEQLDAASDLIQELLKAGIPLEEPVYKPYLVGLFKAGKVNQACDFFRDIITRGGNPDSITPSALLGGFLEAGLVHEACDYYDRMLKEETDSTAVMVDIVSSLSGKMDVACKFFGEIMARKSCGTSIANVVGGLLQANKLDQATEFFAQMVSLGSPPDASISRTLIDALLQADRVTEACKFFEEVYDPSDTEFCRHFVHLLLMANKMDAAKGVFEAVVGRGYRHNTALYDMIIDDFCKLGKFEEAADVLEDLFSRGLLPAMT